jgi:trehalose 6-phosphate phosphatase
MKSTAAVSEGKSAPAQAAEKTTTAARKIRSRGPEYLFDSWPSIARRIHAARQIVLFLDFDGTLVRLRQSPKEVFLGKPARRLLNHLAAHPRVTLCLISGRPLADLRQRAGVAGALYFGLHGWDRSNGKPHSLPAARQLREVCQWVEEQIRGLSGIRLEDKDACFGVHFRGASGPSAKRAKAVVEKALERLGGDFQLMAGKKIWEIYPKDMGTKGAAALSLLKEIAGRKLVIYAGDDTTDETAFASLRNAVTILVGRSRQTQAKFFLGDPAEVMTFLEKLETTISP